MSYDRSSLGSWAGSICLGMARCVFLSTALLGMHVPEVQCAQCVPLDSTVLPASAVHTPPPPAPSPPPADSEYPYCAPPCDCAWWVQFIAPFFRAQHLGTQKPHLSGRRKLIHQALVLHHRLSRSHLISRLRKSAVAERGAATLPKLKINIEAFNNDVLSIPWPQRHDFLLSSAQAPIKWREVGQQAAII